MQRFEKYSGYKDSGVDWIGEIPAGWEVKRLKYLVKRISNGTTSEQLQNVEENDPTVVPVTRIETISHESVNFNKVGWVKYKSILKLFKLNKGDILFSHINSLEMVGKTAIYLDNRELYSGMNLLRIQPKSKINYYWFHYYLKANSSRQFFTSRAKPSINQASLPTTTVYNYYIATPSIKEQTAIANFLDEKTTKIETAITQKEQMISLLKERKQILIQKAVTKGIDPDAKMKDSGVEWVGEIPEGWEVKRLKYLGNIRYGLGQPPKEKNDGLRLIRATNVERGKIVEKGMIFVDPADIPWDRNPELKEDDIIVVRSGAYTGDSAIVPAEYNNSIAGYDMVFTPTAVFPQFIGFSFLSQYVLFDQLYLLRMRAAQPHLNAEELGETLILVPPHPEQAAIVDFIEAESEKINTSITLQQQQITKLKEYKSILIDHAVTGKIKVA